MSKKKLKLTILLPCLNEEKTIENTIKQIKKELKRLKIDDDSEILVSDNGSSDNSVELAKKMGARVVNEKNKGYGNALKKGFKEALGKYIIFADCDESYKFENLEVFIDKLDSGSDIVIGNRYKGNMEKGSMPIAHKYIGTPIISFIGRVLYKVKIGDFNCGLRAVNRDSIKNLEFKSSGMEFATEMIIISKKNNLKIDEVPINFYRDKRDRKPHLRTIRDGIRHLFVLLKNIDEHTINKLIILVLAIKLIIVSVQILYIKGAAHDDYLFLNGSKNILKGMWLGKYNDMTLSKGIAGYLFIVLSRILHIPYITSEQILYFFAVLSILFVLKKVIKNKLLLLLIYIILLFNPITFSDAFAFLYRDGLYTSLILFFIAFSFQIFFNYNSKLKILKKYSLLFGLTYGLIYICREETFSLTPYLIIASIIIILFILFDKNCTNKLRRIGIIFVVPTSVVIFIIFSISTINYIYYGRFITNDFTSKDFKDAYGAVTRIYQENYIVRVPLNEESRNKLYKLSPTFNELKNFLEGDGKKYASKQKDGNYDYKEGFLYWAIREGAYKLGYYKNAKTSEKFYKKLANEINDLCDNGKIKCTKKRSALNAPFYKYKEIYIEIYKNIPHAFKNQIFYDNFIISYSNINNDILYNKIALNSSVYKNNGNLLRLKIMEKILEIYKFVNPIIMFISIICYFIIMILSLIKKFRKKYYKEIILINGILSIYLIRVVSVGLVAATEYRSAIYKTQYLAPSYPVQSLFSLLSIIIFINIIMHNFKTKNKQDI